MEEINTYVNSKYAAELERFQDDASTKSLEDLIIIANEEKEKSNWGTYCVFSREIARRFQELGDLNSSVNTAFIAGLEILRNARTIDEFLCTASLLDYAATVYWHIGSLIESALSGVLAAQASVKAYNLSQEEKTFPSKFYSPENLRALLKIYLDRAIVRGFNLPPGALFHEILIEIPFTLKETLESVFRFLLEEFYSIPDDEVSAIPIDLQKRRLNILKAAQNYFKAAGVADRTTDYYRSQKDFELEIAKRENDLIEVIRLGLWKLISEYGTSRKKLFITSLICFVLFALLYMDFLAPYIPQSLTINIEDYPSNNLEQIPFSLAVSLSQLIPPLSPLDFTPQNNLAYFIFLLERFLGFIFGAALLTFFRNFFIRKE